MKKRFRKLLKIGLWFLSYLIVFGLGMYAYKSENFRKKIQAVSQLTNFSYSKYSAGKNADFKTIELMISDSSMAIIEQCRNNGLKTMILHDTDKVEVPAVLCFQKDSFEVDIRLKGDYSDHWAGDKWSYRIKLSGDERLFGMKSFSIQAPETRGNLNEWYFHKMLENEDLIALRYRFVNLVENGEEKGIYAVEESFDKNLIEANKRREAPILKFDESILINSSHINVTGTYPQEDLYLMSKISVFKSKRTLKNPVLYDQFLKGKTLLEQLRAREIELSEAIDVEKAAKLFAVADLLGAHHALRWKNVRFYFNPVTSRLELIGFDSNNGKMITDIFYNKWKNNALGEFHLYAWKDVFYSDSNFVKLYFENLKRISAPEYLENFNKKIALQKDQNLAMLYKENAMYRFLDEHYLANAKTIRESIAAYEIELNPEPKEYLVTITALDSFNVGDDSIRLKINNHSIKPVIVDGIFNKYETKLDLTTRFKIPGKEFGAFKNEHEMVFPMNYLIDTNQVKMKRKDNRYVYKKIKIGYRFEGQVDTNYSKIGVPENVVINESGTIEKSMFRINEKDKTINVLSGEWSLDESIIIPSGYLVICGPNTSIDISNGAIFTSYSPLQFNGIENNLISIYSSDSSGSFLVSQTKTQSILEHVKFTGLAEIHESDRHLTGGVNFYESPVRLNHIVFEHNKSEDALNIFRSSFILENSEFRNIQADAFDGDFVTGKVLNCIFTEIGNDALDFSGSRVSMINIKIDGVGDKGISAGESSILDVNDVEISNAELGLVSKDYSFLLANNVRLRAVRVAATVFEKKAVFGPACLEINNIELKRIELEQLVELGSILKIDGIIQKSTHDNVSILLYGEEYGKSSR